jgi:hypothetical protein
MEKEQRVLEGYLVGVYAWKMRHKIWEAHPVSKEYQSLANFFNFQIKRVADRFLMEIGANVNAAKEIRRFSEIPLENSTNVQSQIVVCDQQRSQIQADWLGLPYIGLEARKAGHEDLLLLFDN